MGCFVEVIALVWFVSLSVGLSDVLPFAFVVFLGIGIVFSFVGTALLVIAFVFVVCVGTYKARAHVLARVAVLGEGFPSSH